jgi:ribosomal protein S18 acetylase RimI-like enzyme
MAEPRPPAANDIRLRKNLDDTLAASRWPEGFVMRGFEAADAPALHGLLTSVFDDGTDGPFEEWWPRISGDPDFNPALCFLVWRMTPEIEVDFRKGSCAKSKDYCVLYASKETRGAVDSKGRLAGAALCWATAFVKDLAVHPEARGRGVAEALMWHAFAVFRARGAAHVDLKTNTVENAAAVRLYERLGMTPVAWEG